jgi:hypothetical protein
MPVVLSPLLVVRLLVCELSRLRLSEPLLLVESLVRRLSLLDRFSSLRRLQLRPLLPLELLVLEPLLRRELLDESLPRLRDDPLELLLRLEVLPLELRLELRLELLLELLREPPSEPRFRWAAAGTHVTAHRASIEAPIASRRTSLPGY